MRSVLIVAILSLFVSACASSGIDVEPEETIHTCIYNAMDEAVKDRHWVEWDSEANNCSAVSPHRGELLLKQAEIIQNRVCAEFFMRSQMYTLEGWQDYRDNVITACRHPTKRMWFSHIGDQILDLLILDEILN